MYMYLSDRIRRMFLSGACPQNLSPKKPLSLKDQRFLQKTKTDKNLNRILVKQEKQLREKHIGLLQKHFNEVGLDVHGCLGNPSMHAFCFEKVSFLEKDGTILSKKNKPIYLQEPRVSALWNKQPLTDYIKENKQEDISKVKATPSINYVTKGSKHGKNKKLLSFKRKNFDNIWKPFNYGFSRKSLNLFVQHLKVQKENLDPMHAIFTPGSLPVLGNLSRLSKTSKSSNKYGATGYEQDLDSKKGLSFGSPLSAYELGNPEKQQEKKVRKKDKKSKNHLHCFSNNFFHTKNEKTDYLKINQEKISLNDINFSKYRTCRYLYDHESLKTCIVPQIFKNQKPISRAKTLLQERKKIALLYGQLAKKDIVKISRKASILPGFFEDNMFTLLESRVDVCVFRAGFSPTIASARQLIRNGFVLVNGKKICSCKRRAKPGDYFTFKELCLKPYRSTTFELYNLCLSSNFLRQWVFLNKIKFFRKLAHACKARTNSYLNQTNGKRPSNTIPESLLFRYFTTSTKENYKPGVYCSLYWGFFLYKLDKIPFFSCFFATKKKIPMGNPPSLIRKNCNLDGLYPGVIDSSPSFASMPNKLSAEHTLETLGKQAKGHHLNHLNLTLGACMQSMHGGPCSTLKSDVMPYMHAEHAPRKTLMSTDHLGLKGIITEDRLLWCNSLLLYKNSQGSFKVNTSEKKESRVFSSISKKNKNIMLLNLIAQLLLKKQKNLKTKQLTLSPHFLFRKNIPLSNLWAIWGQKPLHLEISHKTGRFIYMYKPQKIICPVRLDFKL